MFVIRQSQIAPEVNVTGIQGLSRLAISHNNILIGSVFIQALLRRSVLTMRFNMKYTELEATGLYATQLCIGTIVFEEHDNDMHLRAMNGEDSQRVIKPSTWN